MYVSMYVCMYVCMQVCINNSFFQAVSKIFCQVIGIPMGSDPAPFFANLFLFFNQSRWLKSIQNNTYGAAKKYGNIFKFIDDLITINSGDVFQNEPNLF